MLDTLIMEIDKPTLINLEIDPKLKNWFMGGYKENPQ